MAGEAIRFNASLNTAGFDSGAARLQQVAAATSGKVSASFASMGANIAGVIAPFVGLYAAVNSVKNALDMGGRLNDLSKTTGETAGNLAILERAFDNAGVGSEKMGMAIASMSNFMTDFQAGSKTASATMDRLGISMADLAGKSPIEQMRVFMAAIAGIQDPALRTALAMDVFKKAGKEIVPLASDFAGEIANARGELGSLPRILDENAASLDQLGDKLTNAVGSKLTELAVGLTAGATGAKDLASALANIDAAGFGEKLGNSLRAAFAAPQEYAMAIGEFLLAGVLKAANALDAAMRHAVNTYYEMMNNTGFWDGLFMYINAGFAKVGEAFFLTIADALKTVLSAMDWNPLWRPFTALAKQSVDEVTGKIREAGETATVHLEQGALQMKAAWNGAVESSKYVYEDTFGAEQHLQKAAEHMARAQEAAAGMKDSSAGVSENLATGSAALTEALDKMRGFNLGGGAGGPFKPSYPGSEGFPTSAGPGAEINETQSSGRGGGGRSGGSGFSSAKELSFNEKVAQLRGESRAARDFARAQELENARGFDSAVRARQRGEKKIERAMEKAAIKDFLRDEFDAGNMGEAYQKYKEENPYEGFGSQMDEKAFEEAMKNQAKTDKEREQDIQEAQQPSKGGGSSGGEDPVVGIAKQIYKLMTERLPIRVLAT